MEAKDENVFDIQQGVALILCVKAKKKTQCPSVYHADLWGTRESKYNCLRQTDVELTSWNQLSPASPLYLFIPQQTNLLSEYEQGYRLSEIFQINSSCMNTARDALVIDTEKSKLTSRIKDIADYSGNVKDLADELNVKNTEWWNFERAISDLRKSAGWKSGIIKCLYRPFDERWLFYHPSFIDRPRTEVNAHMLKRNVSLVTTRQTKEPFAVVATSLICGQHKIAAVYDRSYFFPLYLYTPSENESVLQEEARPNLTREFLKSLAEKLKVTQSEPHGLPKGITAEEIFYYAYAVFHSPTYRTRYADFLKRDFPRLPLTSDLKLFRALAAKGAELVALHLMDSPNLDSFITDFPEKGSNEVERVQYTEKDKRVWINKTQYFGGVPKAVWEFQIGGYQICDKWLKERKGLKLSYADTQQYQKIVVALNETIRLMREIDKAIPQWPIT